MESSIKVREILRNAIDARVFPGAACHLSRGGEVVFDGGEGHLGYELPFAAPATSDTLYDLASLTKIYTLAVALRVLRDASVDIRAPLSHFFSAFDARITLESLMSHTSGIGFAIQSLHQVAAEDWMNRIIAAPLHNEPHQVVNYSCTNFFLIVRVVEMIADVTLDELVERIILRPLSLENTIFAPQNLENVAPTEEKEAKQNEAGFWQGIVHDEAARSWRLQTGTCAGNAGIFASAADVARFAQIWMGDFEILHPDDIKRALEPKWREGDNFRGLGFQLDAPLYMSERAPRGTAGHLGFTGPSLVLHSPSRSVAVILNNRVHPTRQGATRLPYHRQIAAEFFS